MSTRDQHPIEAIHALAAGRLDPAEREAVERHLESCASCRAERELAQATRGIVRDALPGADLPPGLDARIRAALDDEDAGRSEAALPENDLPADLPARRPVWSWLAPAAAVLAAIAALVFLWPEGRPPVPAGERIVGNVAADFDTVRDGTLPLREIAVPGELESYFAEQGVDFHTRVFDLGMMGYELAGGRVATLVERPSVLFAYRNADGVLMLCVMYRGDLAELPAPSRTLEHEGITFQVYERNGRTLVFWEEGDVVCVLTSDAPAQAVIELSFAKAAKV